MYRLLISICWAVTYVLGVALNAIAAPSGPLAQVIEGAKKEGTVIVKLIPGFTQKSMYRLEKEITDKYGVNLTIKFSPSIKMTNDVAEAIMEQNAGATPSYDLITFSSHVATANEAGVLEKVDWKPLLSRGTNPNAVHENPLMRGGIVYHTAFFGLMYNPEKIKKNEVPMTLDDLGNPKWRGREGIETSANSWLRWSFVLGKDKILSALRTILKNGAIQGAYSDLLNRYVIGEILFCTISSEFLGDGKNKGVTAAWQSLDIADVREYSLVVRKGAKHANAAKLVALHLASPEGARFLVEEANAGTLYYPGNNEHDIRSQNQKQGIREVFGDRNMELLQFYSSKEAKQLQKEIQLIMQTGGNQ